MSFRSKVKQIKEKEIVHLPKSPSHSPPNSLEIFLPKSPSESPPLSPKSPLHSPRSPLHSPPKSPKSPLHYPRSPSNSPPKSPKSPSNSPPKKEPKYIFLGFFTHGGYGEAAEPYKANSHASVSMKTHHSVPKLMTFMNSSPGNSLIGEPGGRDNVLLADHFETNSDVDLLDISEFEHLPKKSYDQLVSYKYLNFINFALTNDTLQQNPRDRTEMFKIKNPKDVDVCRNSFICDGKVGISNRFPNKTFSTIYKPRIAEVGESWGIFIYNNNCGIKPGTDIESIKEIQHFTLKNKDGQVSGLDFDLTDIISGLTKKYGLTEDDYLFLFDYSCNNFSNKSINPGDDTRLIRRLGRSVTSEFGLGKKKKKGTRKPGKKNNNKKRTVRHIKK